MAQGIHELNLAVFVRSLRRFSECQIFLFIDNVTFRTKTLCTRYNVTVIIFDKANVVPPYIRKFHPSNYRWFLIQQFLKTSEMKFNRILLADIRDTAFQADPFTIVTSPGFYAFAEGKRFHEDGPRSPSRGWVKACFGDATADSLSGDWILCSGISMGTAEAVAQYLDLMVLAMSAPRFIACEHVGVDQGVHNVLAHTRRLPALRLVLEADGHAAHMQNTLMRTRQRGPPGSRISVGLPGGGEAAIVHQYDRVRPLQEWLFAEYMEWAVPEVSAGTGACAGYSLVEGLDLLIGTGDIEDGFALTEELGGCCRECAARDGCSAFLHSGGGCWLKAADRPLPLAKAVPLRGATTGWRPLQQGAIF